MLLDRHAVPSETERAAPVTPRRASALGAQSSVRRPSCRTSGRRAVAADRSVARSTVTSLIPAPAVALLFGGIAVGGYIFRNQQTDVITVRANDDSAAIGTRASDDPLPASGKARSRSEAIADNVASLGAATPASTVSDVILRQLAARQQTLEDKVLPFLKTHCVECHSAETQEGGIVIDGLSTVDQLLKERKTWERVYRMINAGAMPPADYRCTAGRRRPSGNCRNLLR